MPVQVVVEGGVMAQVLEMRSRVSTSRGRLGVGAGLLVAASAVGGVVSVALGANTWGDAWTAQATLAAPWPMVVVQGVSGVVAVAGRGRGAAAGAAVLMLAALLSAVSGFFDGQLAKEGLAAGHVAMQFVFVGVAASVVVLAAARLRDLVRR